MSSFESKSDIELISELRDGDERVTDYLMEKYKGLVRKKADTMFIVGADKDDLIQEGMIGLFQAIRGYDPGRDASFFTFAELCISRQMIKAVEAGNRKKHSPLNEAISLNGSPQGTEGAEISDSEAQIINVIADLSGKSAEELVIENENAQLLEQHIMESLSEFERSVLYLHLTGMGYVEIAKVLGREEKATDNALSRIKSKVRKIINE